MDKRLLLERTRHPRGTPGYGSGVLLASLAFRLEASKATRHSIAEDFLSLGLPDQKICPRISPGGYSWVCTLTYVLPARMASMRSIIVLPDRGPTRSSAVIVP